MFKEEEVLTCTDIANECRHDPLFDVTGEDGTQEELTLSDILQMVEDDSEEAIAGFQELIQANLEETVEFCDMTIKRVG